MYQNKFDRLLESLETIERQLDRYVEEHGEEVADHMSSLSMRDATAVLDTAPIPTQIKLVNLMDPDLASRVLRRSQNRAMYLANISETQRLLIVQRFSERRNSQALNEVKLWQELEMNTWPNRILPSTVMTGELPVHYPAEMSTCVICGKGYQKLWQSVWLTDCEIHSYHENCDNGKCGACPLGEKCQTRGGLAAAVSAVHPGHVHLGLEQTNASARQGEEDIEAGFSISRL